MGDKPIINLFRQKKASGPLGLGLIGRPGVDYRTKGRGEWRYDRWGNVTLTWPDGKEVFLQGDGATFFLKSIGLDPDTVEPEDWGYIPETVDSDYYDIAD